MYKFASPPASQELRLERPHGARRVTEQQKKVHRHEGGGHQQGYHAYVHLQCLMNDEDNDWWYLGGLGENTWVVLSNAHTATHSRTSTQPCGLDVVIAVIRPSKVLDGSDHSVVFVYQSKWLDNYIPRCRRFLAFHIHQLVHTKSGWFVENTLIHPDKSIYWTIQRWRAMHVC